MQSAGTRPQTPPHHLLGQIANLIRGIKLTLDGASTHPPADRELAKITGIPDAAPWTRNTPRVETDNQRVRRA